MNIDLKIKSLKKNGYIILKNVLSKKYCDNTILKLEKILKDRIKKNKYIGSKNTVVLYNYFIENITLSNLVYHQLVDKFLIKLIDEDYVLISTAARNKKFFNLKNKKFKKSKASGNKWHTDNRYIGGKALKPSINYFVIIALDDFTKYNGGTKFIPKSHLNSKKIIKNYKNFSYFNAKKGSVIIMDSNLLHLAGEPSDKNRWSIFNLYSPWFVKPYFQFTNLVAKKKLSPKVRKILHFDSIPPIDYNKRLTTLIK
jgi:ectoine hydroxylase-related dioxygenase (phytanoyl-CoA dioxygenase family)